MPPTALLVDTCDRPADKPVDRLLATWGEALSKRTPRDRQILASARQGWIDGVKADLYAPHAHRRSKALDDLDAAGLRGSDIPTVQDWLQRVIQTGEVPA